LPQMHRLHEPGTHASPNPARSYKPLPWTPPDVMINTSTVAHQGRWGVHSITVPPPSNGGLPASPLSIRQCAFKGDLPIRSGADQGLTYCSVKTATPNTKHQ